jgi:ATP-dependent Clp protease ATP-binding subunit ClpA
MGARPMSRAIEDKLESFLAKKLLAGEIDKGDSLTIAGKDIV